jgi:hypothetical protein
MAQHVAHRASDENNMRYLSLIRRLRHIAKHVTAMTDEVKNACNEAADMLEHGQQERGC